MTKSISHRFFYSHPPEIVWDYLTKAELLSQWLMENDFQPIPGHEFQFRARPLPDYDFDGIIYCKVLEIVPYKKLSYSWRSGPAKGKTTVDSVVNWELIPKENGTELQLEHTGFTENLSIYPLMYEGWLKNAQKIDALIKAANHSANNS